MERADESLLPGVDKEVVTALHPDPIDLSSLTLYRSMRKSSCYPLATYLAVRHNRTHRRYFPRCLLLHFSSGTQVYLFANDSHSSVLQMAAVKFHKEHLPLNWPRKPRLFPRLRLSRLLLHRALKSCFEFNSFFTDEGL